MSDSRDRLSERLREQVAALHEPEAGESAGLGRDAQRRVVQQLVAEANRLERRRRQRVWLGSGAGALLLAAAAVLLAYLRSPEPAPGAQLTAAMPAQPECRLPVVKSAELAARSFALGALGELVSQPGTQLSVESSSPCELALRLSSGTLAGDLHSLRPARLLIRTDHGEVIVTGTRFSVHSDAELEVLLETGVVDVQLQGAGKLRLQPRTRLHNGQRAALSTDDARRLDGLLKPLPSSPPPTAATAPAPAPQVKPLFESSTAALTAAEAAWRAERWANAREAYRFASQAKDSNAEIALLRWARVELDRAAPATALRLVAEHKRRFSRGVLGADARFIEVQAHKALGHGARAEQAARALIQRYPDTPQAAAARKLIEVD